MRWRHPTALEDEELSQAIQFELVEKGKGGHPDANILIDIVSSPDIQAQFARVARIHIVQKKKIRTCRY